MTGAFEPLFAPIRLRGIEVANRFVFQPHFTALPGTDGRVNDRIVAYQEERARGGAGLIIDGHLVVMPEGKMSQRFLSGWDPEIVPGLQRLTGAVHQHGAKMFAQLTHGGHTSLEHPPTDLWAPTQMPEPYSNFTTKAMDARDIARTVRAFGQTARNVRAGGYDGAEIKVGHDGLLRSFVSPFFNRRTDAYGGTFEKRLRLIVEVLEAVRSELGDNLPLGVRLCLNEYTPFGYDLDYGLRVAQYLEATGLVDYFNCDAGSFSSFWMEIPPAAVPQGFFRPINQALKQSSSLPVIAFGRLKDPDLAAHMVASGEADLIGMARQLIADPETPRKLRERRPEQIRACIGCNDGCLHQVAQDHGIRCIQNPRAGRENELVPESAMVATDDPKSVVVVGGGPAGLKVAEIAARRGHAVTLLERKSELGGLLRLGSRQPHHQELSEVTHYLEAEVRRLGVEVWCGVDADVEGVLDLEPDVVVVATGSQPNLPPGHRSEASEPDAAGVGRARGLHFEPEIPGLASDQVFSVDEVLAGAELPGPDVVVIDGNGHWEAAGTAEYLADAGHHVRVVTARGFVGTDLEGTNLEMFGHRAAQKGIETMPGMQVVAIEPGTVRLRNPLTRAEASVKADAVVPVFTRRSRDDLFLELLDRLDDLERPLRLERVGDAVAPGLVQAALAQAHQLASTI